MSRAPNPQEWWEEEVQFIERESKKTWRMGSFEAYCLMQAAFALKDGYPELAERIDVAGKETK